MKAYFLLIFGIVACCAGVHGARNESNDADSLDFITHIRRFLYNRETKPVYLLSIDSLPFGNHETQQKKSKSPGSESYGKSNVISPPERHQPVSLEKDAPETSTTRVLLNKERLIAKKIKFALYRRSQPFLRHPPYNQSEEFESFGWSHEKVNASLSNRRHYHNKDQIPQRLSSTESADNKDKNERWDLHRRHGSTGQVGSLYSRPHHNQYHGHDNHNDNYKNKRRKASHSSYDGDRYHGYDSFGSHQDTGSNDPHVDHKGKPNSHGNHYSASSYHSLHKHRPVNEGHDHEKYDEGEPSHKPGMNDDNIKPNSGEYNNATEHGDSDWDANDMQEDPDKYRLDKNHLAHRDDLESPDDTTDYNVGSGIENEEDHESHIPIASESPSDGNKDIAEGSQENDNQYGAEDDGEEHQSNDVGFNTSHENSPDKEIVQPNNSEHLEADGHQTHEQQYEHYKPNEVTDPQHQPNAEDEHLSVSSHTYDNHYPEEDEETYDPIDEEDDDEDPFDKYPEEDPTYPNEYNHSDNNDDWNPFDDDNKHEPDEYGSSHSHSDGYYHPENNGNTYYSDYQSSKPQQSLNEQSIPSATTQKPNSIENGDVLDSSDDREPADNEDNGNTSLNQQGSNEENTAPSSQNQGSNNNQGLTEAKPPSTSFPPAVAQEPEEIDPDVAPSPQEQGLVTQPAMPQKPIVAVTSRPMPQPPTPQPTYDPPEYYEEEDVDEQDDLEDYYEETSPSLYDYYNSYPSASQDNPSTPTYYEATNYGTGYDASSPSTEDNPTLTPSYEERRVGKSKRKLRSKLRKRRRRSNIRAQRK